MWEKINLSQYIITMSDLGKTLYKNIRPYVNIHFSFIQAV